MIYICIPVHDEARTIGVLLWKIRRVMAEFGRDYQILVWDDASRDDTAATLARYKRVLPLSIHRSEAPVGYGASLEELLRDAVQRAPYPKRDVIVTLQGDFTEDPVDLVPLVKSIEGGADVVAGTAATPSEVAPSGVRWARLLAPWVLGRAYGRAPVSDPLSGFRAYRVIVMKKVLREAGEETFLPPARWSANLELLVRATPHARRIEESPVTVRYDLQARASRFRLLRALRDLLRFRNVTWGTPGTDRPA